MNRCLLCVAVKQRQWSSVLTGGQKLKRNWGFFWQQLEKEKVERVDSLKYVQLREKIKEIL